MQDVLKDLRKRKVNTNKELKMNLGVLKNYVQNKKDCEIKLNQQKALFAEWAEGIGVEFNIIAEELNGIIKIEFETKYFVVCIRIYFFENDVLKVNLEHKHGTVPSAKDMAEVNNIITLIKNSGIIEKIKFDKSVLSRKEMSDLQKLQKISDEILGDVQSFIDLCTELNVQNMFDALGIDFKLFDLRKKLAKNIIEAEEKIKKLITDSFISDYYRLNGDLVHLFVEKDYVCVYLQYSKDFMTQFNLVLRCGKLFIEDLQFSNVEDSEGFDLYKFCLEIFLEDKDLILKNEELVSYLNEFFSGQSLIKKEADRLSEFEDNIYTFDSLSRVE